MAQHDPPASGPAASLSLSEMQREAIRRLARDERVIRPPLQLARRAFLANDEIERVHALEDPESFWAERSEAVDWIEPWREVMRSRPPHHEWFVGGRLNASVNCLDRHVYGERRNKAALLWVGEEGEEHAYTYNRLYREVNRFANALHRLGVTKGDRVVVYMPLVPEGIIAMLACARIGAIHSVVHAGVGVRALRECIEDCGARVVVCSDFAVRRGKRLPLKPIVDEAVGDLAAVEHVVVHRRGSRPGDAPVQFGSEREKDFYDIQNPRDIHFRPEPMDSEDPLFVLYTSGTSGRPKGIVHTTGGYLVGVTYLSRAFFQIGERDIFWCTSDLGWIVGHSFVVYGPLSIGATIFCREGVPDHPSPDVTWELVERYGINVLLTSPTALRMWRSHGAEVPERYDLSRLRLVASTGEPLDPETHLWAQRNLVGQADGLVVDSFWQTEVAAPVLGGLPTMEVRPGKVGKPLPGAQVDVVDAQGTSLPPDQGGLLVLRGPLPYMMRAVWNNHESYLEYWRRVPGCFTTGDVAVRDVDGYFAALGRADEVVNVAGHRLGMAEIESSLQRHPAIAECAVVGLPDPIKGERIKAFVVLRGGTVRGAGLTANLRDHVRQDVGAIAVPAEIEVREELPKTRSGKILRRFLRAVELDEDPGDLSTLAD